MIYTQFLCEIILSELDITLDYGTSLLVIIFHSYSSFSQIQKISEPPTEIKPGNILKSSETGVPALRWPVAMAIYIHAFNGYLFAIVNAARRWYFQDYKRCENII